LADQREIRSRSDAKLRVAVLDLGSTSFHLLVADASPTGRIERVTRERVMLRLGATIAAEGEIPKAVAARAVECARDLKAVAIEHGADLLLPVATAALRDAGNGAALAQSISRALGTPVRVLSGLEEARLIFAAFRRRIPLGNAPALGMDLGGGSLELAVGDDSEVHWETTLPIGVARLHSELVSHDPMKRRVRKEIEERVESAIAPHRKRIRSRAPKHQIISGGTARALARIIEENGGGRTVKGALRVSLDEIAELAQRLTEATHAELLRVPGLKRNRADLLPTGAVVIEAAMHCLELPDLLICDWGLREGVILETLGIVSGRGSGG
jgi:exopolyphosphatase/guanosine-5'-triphosphate,3'-diphosphate pyrophosphatase